MEPEPRNRPSVEAFRRELAHLINRHSLEIVGGDTPDHVLARYLTGQLLAFGAGVRARDRGVTAVGVDPGEPVRVEGRPAGVTQEPPRDVQPDEADGLVAAAIAWAREPGAGRALLVVENTLTTLRALTDAGLTLGPLSTASFGVGGRTIRLVDAYVSGTDLLGDLFAAAFIGAALSPRTVAEIRRRLELGGDILAAVALPDGDLWSDIESAASRVAGEASPRPANGGPGPATRALLEQLTERLTDGVLDEAGRLPADVLVFWRPGQREAFRAAVAARVAAVLAGSE